MSKPIRDKQKELTAASLKRIARWIRTDASDYRKAGAKEIARAFQKIAKALDAEAKLLRSMR